MGPVLALRGGFGFGDFREINCASRSACQSLELFAHESPDSKAKCVKLVRFLGSVVMNDEPSAGGWIDVELTERVPVERRQKQVPHPDIELDTLALRFARGRYGLLLVVDEKGSNEAA